jgi:modulator of FtsH protease HflC
MKRNPITLAVGLLLVVIFGLPLILFQVRQTQVAIVTTFGKPTRQITEPGPHWKWPWPIQQVHRFDQKVQNFEDTLNEGPTSDQRMVLTSVYVGWKVTNAASFFPKFQGSSEEERIAEAEKHLKSLAGNAKLSIVSKHALSDFISTADNGARFLAIEQQILTELKSRIQTNDYGVDIEFLGLKRLEFPETVTEKVLASMTAERNNLAQSLQSEGDREAQRIRDEANRTAAETLIKARRDASQISSRAEAEAAESLAVLQRNPELANYLAALKALEAALKEKATLVFDTSTLPFKLLSPGASTNFTNLR